MELKSGIKYSGQYVVDTYGYDWYMNLFTFIPLQLLTAIALGLWLSIDHKWDSPRNLVIWLLGSARLQLSLSIQLLEEGIQHLLQIW